VLLVLVLALVLAPSEALPHTVVGERRKTVKRAREAVGDWRRDVGTWWGGGGEEQMRSANVRSA
jgi:hypothetical protein